MAPKEKKPKEHLLTIFQRQQEPIAVGMGVETRATRATAYQLVGKHKAIN
jgi:hypothetical protein